MVQIYVCVEGLDIVMRSASPHCVPAVPQPYFPFIFAKPPPLLHFHFIFAKIQKTYLSYQIVDFLHMDFCAHCELFEVNAKSIFWTMAPNPSISFTGSFWRYCLIDSSWICLFNHSIWVSPWLMSAIKLIKYSYLFYLTTTASYIGSAHMKPIWNAKDWYLRTLCRFH